MFSRLIGVSGRFVGVSGKLAKVSLKPNRTTNWRSIGECAYHTLHISDSPVGFFCFNEYSKS